MDRPDRPTTPSLQPLARELAASRAPARVRGGPARRRRARVSEPGLPLLLGALHLHLGGPRSVLLPEDADARDAAEAASWYLGEEQVALFPSRGVGWDSGLEPPPHLVGERARALDVLAAGGLVCASAAALAEGAPPPEARPARLDLGVGDEPGIDSARRAAGARGLRAGRAGRGARAVRGSRRDRRRLPDHRPRPAADRAVRRRDRGDPRVLAVHAAGASAGGRGDRLPGGRAAARPRPDRAARRRASRGHRTTSCRRSTASRTSCSSPRRSRGYGKRSRSPRFRSATRRCSIRSRAGSSGVRGAAAGGRRPRARRGRAGARLLRPRRTARRGRVSAPG